MSLSPGQTLLHYRLAGKIGEGGMGEVWRAADTTLGRDVAIKLLPPAFLADPERMARFEREAKVLASLNHPGIAAIYGFHEANGVRFLAMEMVEGEDLSQRLSRGAIPVDEALPLARRIAEALEYAHDQGIVHRDLKPANVKVTPDSGVKVLDFGLAKAIAGETASRDGRSTPTVLPTVTSAGTVAGIILGTAAYMSPEQARGKPVDKRTDIWAFGCVLYECLTGKQLFEGETVSDLIAKILQTEPDWSGLPTATPPRIRALLARCLQKDAKERLRDIGEARIALASPGDATPAAATATRRGGLPWWAAVAGALALTVIAVLATQEFGPTTATQPLRKFDLVANDLDFDWSHAPVLSPDGGRIAYLSKNRIWVRDLTELAPRALADVSSSTPIGWSPDSRSLVFADARKLFKVPIDGGRPTAICEIPGTGSIIGASWSRSGVIALAVWRGGLYKVAASGGTAELLIDIDPATTVDFHGPSWLANGDLLYITHWNSEKDASGRRRVFITVFDGKQQIPVAGGLGNDESSAIVAPTGELLFLRQSTNPGLWSAPYDMTHRRVLGAPVLLAPDAASVSVSDDGSLLYVEGSTGEERRELIWVDRSGKVIEAVGSGHAGLTGVTLSPDGRRVAFTAQDGGSSDVWVRDLARGTETRLTFSGDFEGRPEWIASSSRLAFTRVSNLQGRIFAVDADGSGGEREFASAAGMGAAASSFSVASDGKWAVRIVDERGEGRLRVGPVLPNGSLGDLRPLLELKPEPDIRDARIAPDGKLLAYVLTDPRRAAELYLTRFPEGVGRWQVRADGALTPRWAKGSGELFFVEGSGPSRRAMVSVKVDSAQDPPLGESARLFDMSDGGQLDYSRSGGFDVTSDGNRFLFVRAAGRTGGPPQRMVLVQNWREELKKAGAR